MPDTFITAPLSIPETLTLYVMAFGVCLGVAALIASAFGRG